MRIATWNVNGIRARQAQLASGWSATGPTSCVCRRSRPSRPRSRSAASWTDYCVYWHCRRGYSGVSLQIRKDLLERAGLFHPDFDMESRIVQADDGNLVLASVYVPNGGKDFPAKMSFLERACRWAGGCMRKAAS